MSKLLDKELARWAAETRKGLDETTAKLIKQANYDLHYGPVGDGAVGDPAADDEDEWTGWPGFSKACGIIKEALREAVPSQLYFDVDCGEWQENEPEPERCETCVGDGKFRVYNEATGSDCIDTVDPCPDCWGRGQFDPSGDWYLVERGDLLRALLGKELTNYI